MDTAQHRTADEKLSLLGHYQIPRVFPDFLCFSGLDEFSLTEKRWKVIFKVSPDFQNGWEPCENQLNRSPALSKFPKLQIFRDFTGTLSLYFPPVLVSGENVRSVSEGGTRQVGHAISSYLQTTHSFQQARRRLAGKKINLYVSLLLKILGVNTDILMGT